MSRCSLVLDEFRLCDYTTGCIASARMSLEIVRFAEEFCRERACWRIRPVGLLNPREIGRQARAARPST
jgi:hypothetical protein